jgi:hypothetical protein
MNELKTRAITSLLQGLQNLKCSYLVVMEDGNRYEFGTLKQKKKARGKYEYGAMRKYYGPFLTGIQPGEVVEIKGNAFDVIDLQSGISAWGSKMFGKGALMTSINREKNVIEVLRIL